VSHFHRAMALFHSSLDVLDGLRAVPSVVVRGMPQFFLSPLQVLLRSADARVVSFA
jgi:hypothetical protein